MADVTANQLRSVDTYLDEYALAYLANYVVITPNSRKLYDFDKRANRGDTQSVKLPTKFLVEDGLGLDISTQGSTQERLISVTVDQQKSVRKALTADEIATFPGAGDGAALKMDGPGVFAGDSESIMSTIADTIETFSAGKVCFGGYRFLGSPIVQPGQMQTASEINEEVARFRSFGGTQKACFVIPLVAAQNVRNSLQQEFVLSRNEEVSRTGEIGSISQLGRVTYYQSQNLPVHISGTAADNPINSSTGYTLTGVATTQVPGFAFPAGESQITMTGMTPNETVLVDDVLDIGVNNVLTNPAKFLSFNSSIISSNNVQARVTATEAVSGSGDILLTVEPALTFDATNTNVNANLNRELITSPAAGFDTVRIATSHRAGALWFPDYFLFGCPPLQGTAGYPSRSKRSNLTGISVRLYVAFNLTNAATYWTHDTIYGAGVAPEGLSRVLFPLS